MRFFLGWALNSKKRISRKDREKEARKRDILEVAAQLFASRGFHDVKVDDIAESVGLSKGTIYLYFENKDNLFLAMLTERLEAFDKQLSQAVRAEASFHEQLERFIYSYLTFFRENESFYKIVHSEKTRMSIENHYKLHEYSQSSYLKISELITKMVAQGIEEGALRPLDPQSLGLSLVGILNMIIYHSIFMGVLVSLKEDTAMIMNLFLYGAANQANIN